jgi:hypothetical protein
LLAKRNPVLVAAVADAEVRGQAAGRAQAIVLVLSRRGLVPSDEEREQILVERDLARLDDWLARALSCATVAALFDE